LSSLSQEVSQVRLPTKQFARLVLLDMFLLRPTGQSFPSILIFFVKDPLPQSTFNHLNFHAFPAIWIFSFAQVVDFSALTIVSASCPKKSPCLLSFSSSSHPKTCHTKLFWGGRLMVRTGCFKPTLSPGRLWAGYVSFCHSP